MLLTTIIGKKGTHVQLSHDCGVRFFLFITNSREAGC